MGNEDILSSTEWRTVMTDPPWTPAMSVTNGGAPKASPQRHYKTLTFREIVDIRPKMARQAHLYVWCLTPHIDWGFDLCRAWGAEPVTVLTWRKPGLGAGRFRCNTEHIILARVGPRSGNPFGTGGRYKQATAGTVFDWPRGRHSAKPQEAYDLAAELSPSPRLEMYARSQRPGWSAFGDECADIPPPATKTDTRRKP